MVWVNQSGAGTQDAMLGIRRPQSQRARVPKTCRFQPRLLSMRHHADRLLDTGNFSREQFCRDHIGSTQPNRFIGREIVRTDVFGDAIIVVFGPNGKDIPIGSDSSEKVHALPRALPIAIIRRNLLNESPHFLGRVLESEAFGYQNVRVPQ